MCWRPCIWSSLGVKLRKLDFLLRSQKYDSPFFPHFSSASLRPPWLLRDLAETVRKHSSLVHVYRCAAISTCSKSRILRHFCVLIFYFSFRSFFHVLLSFPLFSPALLLSFPSPLRSPGLLHVVGQYYPRRASRTSLIPFSLIWICPRSGSKSDAKFFLSMAPEISSATLERVLLVSSRTFVMYAHSFMKWNLLPVCWIPANVCQQTVPFKLYMSRHGNRGPSLNSIASHERLRGFRRKFAFRRMSTSFFFFF